MSCTEEVPELLPASLCAPSVGRNHGLNLWGSGVGDWRMHANVMACPGVDAPVEPGAAYSYWAVGSTRGHMAGMEQILLCACPCPCPFSTSSLLLTSSTPGFAQFCLFKQDCSHGEILLKSAGLILLVSAE